MRYIESMSELESVLSKIEGLEWDVDAFISVHRFQQYNPADLMHMGAIIKFKSDNARRILSEIYEEEKRNGHLEIAVDALNLRLHLSDLEKEVMGKNKQ